jgi:hypothetical protein
VQSSRSDAPLRISPNSQIENFDGVEIQSPQ